jgi:hypothetical protein
MPTNRPTLEEVSPEVRASNLLGQKHNEAKQAADDEHRRLQAAPIEDRTARLAKIAKGEPVAPHVDRETMLRTAANRCRETRDVCDLHHTNDQVIKRKALGDLCKSHLPEQKEILKRVGVSLSTLQAALVDYRGLRQYLIGEGGLVGICLTDFDRVFGNPSDRNSNLGFLLQELVKLGALDKIPAGLK